MYVTDIELWEVLLAPLYLLLAVAIALFYPSRKDRRWFSIGLSARMTGAIFYALIYLYYYQGGDTLAYFNTALPFSKLILQDPVLGIRLLFESYSTENYAYFTESTGFPYKYIYVASDTYMVSRVITPFLLLSFNSYFISTMLIAMVSFIGPWKLYTLFLELRPDRKYIAIASGLLFPSVLFWGSGISKDTLTFTALCYLVYSFYHTLVKRRYNVIRIILSIVMTYLIIIVKPYVFLVLFPGAVVWFFYDGIQRIRNRFLRVSLIPMILVVSLFIFALTYSAIADILGEYGSTDQIIEKAIITQEDLLRDQYGSNSFDIGTIDPSFVGVLSKFPIATFFGFFGPTLLNVNSIVMLFSALENTILLFLTFYALFWKPMRSFQMLRTSPFLIFCLFFSVLLAFAIGLTTPNFGALVRFKIPFLPFFAFLLLCLYFGPIKSKKTNQNTTR